jgi:hypothetical protein
MTQQSIEQRMMENGINPDDITELRCVNPAYGKLIIADHDPAGGEPYFQSAGARRLSRPFRRTAFSSSSTRATELHTRKLILRPSCSSAMARTESGHRGQPRVALARCKRARTKSVAVCTRR